MAEPRRRGFSREQIEKSIATRRARAAERRAQREKAERGETQQAPKNVEELEAHAQDTLEAAISPEAAKRAQQELAETFSQFLVIGTVLGALAVQQPSIAMLDHEAAALAVPLANIFAKTDLNRKFGRYLVGSNDYVALAWAGYQYGKRVLTGWIGHEQTIQSQRHFSPAGNGVGSSGAADPSTSPKAGRNGTASGQPGPTISISPNLFGGGWRGD